MISTTDTCGVGAGTILTMTGVTDYSVNMKLSAPIPKYAYVFRTPRSRLP